MTRILTFDLGTTYFKAALFDDAGRLLHAAHEPLKVEHPHPGWWELPGDSFERHVLAVAAKLRTASPHGFEGVEAVSFATQTNSIRLLDKAGDPLTPLMLWPDERAVDTADLIPRLTAGIDHRSLTGVAALSHYFTPARLMHASRTMSQWKSVARLCLISDVFTLWLTGEHVTEAGACGLTGMIDIHKLQWLDSVCAAAGIAPSCLARIVRAGTDLGVIRREAAEQFGLPRSCRFVVGCLDQYAGAIGAGNVTPNQLSETTGTVLATGRCADRFKVNPPPGVYQGPGFAEGVYFEMMFGSISANLLEAYRNALPDRPAFAELDRLAAQVPPGAGGLRLGRAPDPTRPQTLFDRPLQELDRGAATRAILEAVAFALADQVQGLCGSQRPGWVRAVGGAARSGLWRQIKADVLDCPVAATLCAEPTSLGAAMLAAAALHNRSVPQLAEQWIRTAPPNNPSPPQVKRYRQLGPPASRH